MIDDAMVATGQPHAIHRLATQIAQPQPNISHDGVLRPETTEGVVANADPFAWSSLSSNRKKLILFAENKF